MIKIKPNKEDDFIDDKELQGYLDSATPTENKIRIILEKAKKKERLSMEESAILITNKDPKMWEEIYSAARYLKELIYGKRMVLFAPIYLGSECINNCSYCGFSVENKDIKRITLEKEELKKEIKGLEDMGHKRIIIVYGESPKYDGERIAKDVATIYETKSGNGEIRRVNVNAAPMDVENFKKVYNSGIGTWQIFQETYHHDTYKKVHKSGPKSIYEWRISGLDRAMEAGIDDVGIGALFGLYDYKFEVMGLLKHTQHLEEKFGVGPHTISFPRLNEAFGMDVDLKYKVSDEELKQIIAVLRLSVPYTGLILTAREPAELRRELFKLGISQTDAGTSIEMKSYSNDENEKSDQDLSKEQFKINDVRSLDSVLYELLEDGYVPSFCTGCYRAGRTGEHFMEFSIPGFIHDFCMPNALLTTQEYLIDYASPKTLKLGEKMIDEELLNIKKYNPKTYDSIHEKLMETRKGTRDLYI